MWLDFNFFFIKVGRLKSSRNEQIKRLNIREIWFKDGN